jgi:hypothetical protein
MKPAHSTAQPAARSLTSLPMRPVLRHRTTVRLVRLSSFTLVLATVGAARIPAAGPAGPPQPATGIAVPDTPARSWAVDCTNNEALVIQHPDSFLRYRLHVIDEKGDHLRDQIETPEGSVGRNLQSNGRPLTAAEDAEERQRLNDLLASPSSFQRHIRREQENKQMGLNLLKLMPDAMVWSYTPGQPQLPNQPSGDPALVVIDFKPNPAWSPPNFEAEPLTGLEGRAWIDPRTRRMVRLEANIVHAVNIGWGFVAHIYPGGSVTLQQANVGGQRWIVEHIVEQLELRALMLKTVHQRLVFDTAEYQPVPAMTYQQAIKILLDTPLPTQ